MSEENKLTRTDDALVMVYSRNEFYQNKFHWMLGVFFLGLIAIVSLIAMLMYLSKNPVHPLYFISDNAGRLIQDIPLQQPNLPTADVAAWAQDAVVAANSYDYANYHAQLQASNNLEALTKRKLIFLAKVSGPVKLVAEGRVGKTQIYAWRFRIPVLITYLSPPYDGKAGKSKFENAYIFSVLVMRQSILTSYKGLGIMQIIGASAQSASNQDLLLSPSS
jgi:intracellular multiplication protein IcmL